MKRNAFLKRRRKVLQKSAKCAVCGDYLIGKRRGARYCSDACRQVAYRLRGRWSEGDVWAAASARAAQLLDQARRQLESS